MADIIQLLPDFIANQIAAGEVVQRPASVVKELLENAIDAGGTKIKLIIADAGKQLVQVIDNGSGMSPSDARMSFERHATSKINTTDDLYAIRTLGFRGEALASIAAVAQVEVKTRLHDQDVGTHLIIEGSTVIKQAICETTPGTDIQVKNLFFNIPARRKFLKSNTVEYRHILDEFQRLALANPEIHFEAYHNGNEAYHLPATSFRKRIVNIFGKSINEKLVPISEETDLCGISGFIGKPQTAKKSRNGQFFLINDRFIKSPYLHHAVLSAYGNLIAQGYHPFYVLAITIDPKRLDVNVHPTKQEIKFEDEALAYNIIKASVKHVLNQYHIAPSIDFERDPALEKITRSPSVKTRDNLIVPSSFSRPRRLDDWQELYAGLETQSPGGQIVEQQQIEIDGDVVEVLQVHNVYIISLIKSGFVIVDQQNAHERILYERYLAQIHETPLATQKLAFPKTFELSTEETTLFTPLLSYLNSLGYEIEEFGKNTFILQGIPAHLSNLEENEGHFADLIEQMRMNIDLDWQQDKKLALMMAKSTGLKRGVRLNKTEMQSLIDQLFACDVPFESPTGKKCFITIKLEELLTKFNY